VLKDAPDGHIIEDVDEHPFVIHIADAERLETGLEWKASIEPLKRWHDHERAALFVHDRLDGPVRARGDHHTMRMPGLHDGSSIGSLWVQAGSVNILYGYRVIQL
jgi:hypothetical protein